MSGPRDEPTALDRALRLLGRRPHFRAELRDKLVRKGHDENDVQAALERLSATGYLDDRSLAVAEAERLRERKGLARAAVASALRKKGAGDDAVAVALEGRDADDELELGLDAGRRWLRSGREDAAALARHLARKGFQRRAIFRILKELLPGDRSSSGLD